MLEHRLRNLTKTEVESAFRGQLLISECLLAYFITTFVEFVILKSGVAWTHIRKIFQMRYYLPLSVPLTQKIVGFAGSDFFVLKSLPNFRITPGSATSVGHPIHSYCLKWLFRLTDTGWSNRGGAGISRSYSLFRAENSLESVQMVTGREILTDAKSKQEEELQIV